MAENQDRVATALAELVRSRPEASADGRACRAALEQLLGPDHASFRTQIDWLVGAIEVGLLHALRSGQPVDQIAQTWIDARGADPAQARWSVGLWDWALRAAGQMAAAPPVPDAVAPPDAPEGSTRTKWLVAAGALAVVLGLVGVLVLTSGNGEDTASPDREAEQRDERDDAPDPTDGPTTTADEAATSTTSTPIEDLPPTEDPFPPEAILASGGGDPLAGGRLVFALESESDGWDPAVNRWAVAGHQVAQAIFDPLAVWSEAGEPVPFLAESFGPNDDFTEWTIVLRDGAVFHDGTDLDADAVVSALATQVDSVLMATALAPVDSVEATGDLEVTVSMSTPWAAFPAALTGQAGYIPAPASSGDLPIGTGPFVFGAWEVDNRLEVVRNPEYWRAGLPYLDEIEFVVVPDEVSRRVALAAGDVDVLQATGPDDIAELRSAALDGELQLVHDGGLGSEVFVLLNLDAAPLDDPTVREALAAAIDRDDLRDALFDGAGEDAASPFDPSSPWHSPAADAAYPTYDPDRAASLVDDYEDGNGPLELTLSVPASTEKLQLAQLLQSTWEGIGAFVEIQSTQQADLITSVLTGDFQAALWVQFDAPDPDLEAMWWQSADPDASFSLNMAQIDSAEVDEALAAGRATADPDDRYAAYQGLQVALNQELPYLWLYRQGQGVAAQERVRGLGDTEMADGTVLLPLHAGMSGAVPVAELWLDS